MSSKSKQLGEDIVEESDSDSESESGEDDSIILATDSEDDFDAEEYRRNRRKQFQEQQLKQYNLHKEMREKMKDTTRYYDSDSDSDDKDGDEEDAEQELKNLTVVGSKWVEEMAKKAEDIPEELFSQPLKKTKRVLYDSNVVPSTPIPTGRNEEQPMYTSTPFVGASAHLQSADVSMSPVVPRQPTTNLLFTVRKDRGTAPTKNVESQIENTIDAIDPFQGKTLRRSNNIPTEVKGKTRQSTSIQPTSSKSSHDEQQKVAEDEIEACAAEPKKKVSQGSTKNSTRKLSNLSKQESLANDDAEIRAPNEEESEKGKPKAKPKVKQQKKAPVVANHNPSTPLVIHESKTDDGMPNSQPLPEGVIEDVGLATAASEAVAPPVQTSSRPRKRITRATEKGNDSVQRVPDEEAELVDKDEPIAKKKKATTTRKEPTTPIIHESKTDDEMPNSQPLPEGFLEAVEPNRSLATTASEAVAPPVQTSSPPRKRTIGATEKGNDSVHGVQDEEAELLDKDEPVAKKKKATTIRKEPAIKLPKLKKPILKAPEALPSPAKRKIQEKSEQVPKRSRRRLLSTSSESEPLETEPEPEKGPRTRTTTKPNEQHAPERKTTRNQEPRSAPAVSTSKTSSSKTGRNREEPKKVRYVGNDVRGNYHMLSSEKFKDLMQSTHPNLELSKDEMDGIELKLNHFLEDFFVHHCNQTRLPFGFISFKHFKEALIEQCLVDENATDAEFIQMNRDFMGREEFKKERELGILIPKPGEEDTAKFLYQ